MTIKMQVYRGKCFGKFKERFPEDSDIWVATWLENGIAQMEAFGSLKGVEKFIKEREVIYEYNKHSES